MSAPSASDIYNTAQAQTFRGDTPGLNAVIGAWRAFIDFGSDWGANFFAEQDAINNVLISYSQIY